MMFRDGERRIDYILAYNDTKDEDLEHKRDEYHNTLIKDGLELEIEDKQVGVGEMK